ncbi:hypothetical protein ACQ4PT_064115 [Festuca glaucescens]
MHCSDDFTGYADVCFSSFGDRVKQWTTVNEPNIEPIGWTTIYHTQRHLPPPPASRRQFCTGSPGPVVYRDRRLVKDARRRRPGLHHFAPPRCAASLTFRSRWDRRLLKLVVVELSASPTSTNTNLDVALLLSIGSARKLFDRTPTRKKRIKLSAVQRGRIGLTLLAYWYESETEKPEDREAAARANDFSIGCDYPPVMRRNVGSRLPELTPDESARVRGSFDFVGINQYGAILFEADLSQLKRKLRDYYGDTAAKFVTREFLYDGEFRSHFLQVYIEAALSSIRNGSDVRGYFVWSFLDVFEILFAYRFRFGLFGVNFGDEQRTRYARNSARWYASFLHGGELRPVATGGDRTGFYSE